MYKFPLPDQNGPQTPGMKSLFSETTIWHVEVPQTKTIRWHRASLSDSEHISVNERIYHLYAKQHN